MSTTLNKTKSRVPKPHDTSSSSSIFKSVGKNSGDLNRFRQLVISPAFLPSLSTSEENQTQPLSFPQNPGEHPSNPTKYPPQPTQRFLKGERKVTPVSSQRSETNTSREAVALPVRYGGRNEKEKKRVKEKEKEEEEFSEEEESDDGAKESDDAEEQEEQEGKQRTDKRYQQGGKKTKGNSRSLPGS